MLLTSPASVLRWRGAAGDDKIAFVELTFDLVFVSRSPRLAHTLLHHFTLIGALETGFLFLAVWWVWIFTGR
jgi:low temperature requirement protein LtrA